MESLSNTACVKAFEFLLQFSKMFCFGPAELKMKSLLTTPSNVLPLHSKPKFKCWQPFAVDWSWFLETQLIWATFREEFSVYCMKIVGWLEKWVKSDTTGYSVPAPRTVIFAPHWVMCTKGTQVTAPHHSLIWHFMDGYRTWVWGKEILSNCSPQVSQ